jgi:predicted phosphodiesterase
MNRKSQTALLLTTTLLASTLACAQEIDLVAAKQDQDARLTTVNQQLTAAQTAGNADQVAALQKQLTDLHAQDPWHPSSGPPALTLHPDQHTFSPFNFAVMSDLHLSERQGKQRLNKAFDLIAQRHDLAFVLVLGDIVWDSNPDNFKPILAQAKIPVHLVYGNNDWKWLANGTYEKAFGPRDYSFTYNNCTFIAMYDCLPKGHFPEDHKGDFQPAQWTWLEDQLKTAQANHSTHTFTAMHIPPDAPGGFDKWFTMYQNTEQRFFDLLEQYHADVALFGHLHQSIDWTHDNIQCSVTPSDCWNFVTPHEKVDSSFVRLVKVEQDKVSTAVLPVHLDGETFTWETLKAFYNPDNHPK